MISGEIKRFLRDDGMIKVSRSLKELAVRSLQTREKLTDRLGREPTLEELAGEMGVDKEEIVQAMEAGSEVESLYRPIHQKEGSEIRLLDKIEEKERKEDRILDRMVLKQLLETLEPKERQLIYLRYFAEKTQSDVGGNLPGPGVQAGEADPGGSAETRKINPQMMKAGRACTGRETARSRAAVPDMQKNSLKNRHIISSDLRILQ